MELLLNLAWAVMAGTAILAFLLSAPDRHRRYALALGALCCALLLLFPTISVSDDVHIQAFVVEDSNPTKRLVNAAHTSLEHFTAVSFILGSLFFGLFRLGAYIRIFSAVPNPPSFLSRPVFGRAPPQPLAA